MRAWVLTELGGPEALGLREIDPPEASDTVLIDVASAGVNFPDLLMMRGGYQVKVSPPYVPGSEVAGVVRWAPAGCGVVAGERVIAACGTGGYADVATAPVHLTRPLPDGLDFAGGVALLANFQTAYFALVLRGRLRPGETVMVLGAAGGVGSAAVQVAKALGAHVVAVVHRTAAVEFVTALGADLVVPLEEGWATAVSASGVTVDVVVDPVGGTPFVEAVNLLSPGGVHVVVGFAAGGIPSVAVDRLSLRNTSVVGAGWGEYIGRVPTAFAEVSDALAALVEQGLRPKVCERMPFERGREAVERLAAGKVLGKIVITT